MVNHFFQIFKFFQIFLNGIFNGGKFEGPGKFEIFEQFQGGNFFDIHFSQIFTFPIFIGGKFESRGKFEFFKQFQDGNFFEINFSQIFKFFSPFPPFFKHYIRRFGILTGLSGGGE